MLTKQKREKAHFEYAKKNNLHRNTVPNNSKQNKRRTVKQKMSPLTNVNKDKLEFLELSNAVRTKGKT